MFTAKDEYTIMLGACMKIALARSRGDTIAHEEIEKAAGIKRDAPQWGHLIQKLKRKLRKESGITVWSVPGIGYKLCTRDEQLNEVSENLLKQSVRRSSRAIAEVDALPIRELDMTQRRVKHYRMNAMRKQRQLMRASIRDQAKEAKSPTQPLRKPSQKQEEKTGTDG